MVNFKISDVIFVDDDSYTPTAQCDCACAENKNRTANFGIDHDNPESVFGSHKKNKKVNFYPMNDDSYVAFGEDSIFSVLSPKAKLVYDNFDDKFSDQEYIVENFSIVKNLILCNILHPLDYQEKILKDESTELIAWLHITDICNLRCEYCYLPHDSVSMDLNTAKKCINTTINTALLNDYKSIKLKIAGGEPLINFSLIKKIYSYAHKELEGKDLDLDFVVLSNATLLNNEMAEYFSSKSIRLMISLDGTAGYHGLQRPLNSGKNSYVNVIEGLKRAVDHNLNIDISVTISGKNAPGLGEITDYLLEQDLAFGYNFYRENKISKNTLGLKLDSENIISALNEGFKVIGENLPNRNLLACLADKADLSRTKKHTCSASRDYFVFDTSGNISQCQMQQEQIVSNVHKINPLDDIRTNKSLENLSVDDKDECKSCEWKNWCGGGCPVETKLITDRYDTKSPNCSIYKAIFPSIIKLEGERLLKYAT